MNSWIKIVICLMMTGFMIMPLSLQAKKQKNKKDAAAASEVDLSDAEIQVKENVASKPVKRKKTAAARTAVPVSNAQASVPASNNDTQVSESEISSVASELVHTPDPQKSSLGTNELNDSTQSQDIQTQLSTDQDQSVTESLIDLPENDSDPVKIGIGEMTSQSVQNARNNQSNALDLKNESMNRFSSLDSTYLKVYAALGGMIVFFVGMCFGIRKILKSGQGRQKTQSCQATVTLIHKVSQKSKIIAIDTGNKRMIVGVSENSFTPISEFEIDEIVDAQPEKKPFHHEPNACAQRDEQHVTETTSANPVTSDQSNPAFPKDEKYVSWEHHLKSYSGTQVNMNDPDMTNSASSTVASPTINRLRKTLEYRKNASSSH